MSLNSGGSSPLGVSDDSPVDELDEQLVAYLDGELEPSERSEIESRLGRDEYLRKRLRDLQEGWELLDELPTASPSPTLLETTMRMAALEATGEAPPSPRSDGRKPLLNNWARSKTVWIGLLAVAGFVIGAVAVRLNDTLRFERELRELPIAMQVDAYLHAGDLELMRLLMQLPKWQETVAVADQLGEWDFTLPRTIRQATPEQRRALLPQLSLEDQQEVVESWRRFRSLDDADRRTVTAVVDRVGQQSDSDALQATMNRYALWRQSLPPAERAVVEGPDTPERRRVIENALQRTMRQWTQQTARTLSEEDTDSIYQSLRQIARLRLRSLDLRGDTMEEQILRAFVRGEESASPVMETIFLRRLFEMSDYGPPGRDPAPPPRRGPGEEQPPRDRSATDQADTGVSPVDGRSDRSEPEPSAPRRPPGRSRPPGPPGFDFFSPPTGPLTSVTDPIRGPLSDDELWLIEVDLSPELGELIAAASAIEGLREELLLSWAEEALRRMRRSVSGTTLTERYELLDPSRRDLLDLLPPDRILRSLSDDRRRRRP